MIICMVINETSIFTKKIAAILSDDEYRELQAVLVKMPDAGEIIEGSGGIRKIRWGASGRGKRGGKDHLLLSHQPQSDFHAFRVCKK